MLKKVLKFAGIAAFAVAALGLGRLLASKVLPKILPPGKVPAKAQEWLFDLVALATGIVGAVVGTKLATKFFGAGGPNVTAKL